MATPRSGSRRESRKLFPVADNSHNLKHKTITGVFWQLLQKGSVQVVSFVVSVILARLIDPDEFGLVAMAAIFMAVANVLADSGLGTSLVQKKEVDELDKDTVFHFGFLLSAVLYLILFLCAPLIARMYKAEALTDIVRVSSIALFFTSFNSVQGAIVMRSMDFRKYFYANLSATLLSAAVGIWMAYAGYGVWALVFQTLVRSVSVVLVLFLLVRWVPRFRFSWERLKTLFSFGFNLTAANLVGTLFNELRGFLIGLRFMPADLAFYNRGNSIPALVNDNVNGTISTVLFPAMTKLQDDKSAVKQSMRRAMMTSAFFLAPLMVMLAATAKQLVLILFTEKWLGAVPFMQVISLGYIFSVMGSANLQAINAIGRSDITFKLEFIKKPFYLAIILGTMLISPLAIAAGNAVYNVIGSAVNAIPNKRLIDYRYGEQLLDILPQLLLALIAGGAAFAIGQLPWNIYVVLLLQLAVGAALYMGLARLFQMESLRYVIETIRDYRNSKRNLPDAVQEG